MKPATEKNTKRKPRRWTASHAPAEDKRRDAEGQWALWPRRPVPDPASFRRGVLCVHGIGGGTGSERRGFSEKLRRLVFPDLSETDAASVWRECVWEGLSDEMDSQLASVIREMACGPLMDGLIEKSRKARGVARFLGLGGEGGKYLRMMDRMTREMAAGFVIKMLDFGLDYCLYFDTCHGRLIRERLMKSIADAANGRPGGIVLFAHSLGSVIAYDVLCEARRAGTRLPVAGFISCGSPLEWTLRLRAALGGDGTSATNGIGTIPWTNIYYREDCVCLYKPLPANRFPEARNVVLPLPKRATARTAHAAYWRDGEVARIVREDCW